MPKIRGVVLPASRAGSSTRWPIRPVSLTSAISCGVMFEVHLRTLARSPLFLLRYKPLICTMSSSSQPPISVRRLSERTISGTSFLHFSNSSTHRQDSSGKGAGVANFACCVQRQCVLLLDNTHRARDRIYFFTSADLQYSALTAGRSSLEAPLFQMLLDTTLQHGQLFVASRGSVIDAVCLAFGPGQDIWQGYVFPDFPS